jgi:hypothetical protein
MERCTEYPQWIGKRLFEVDVEIDEVEKPVIPRWFWALIGFIGGYFTAAIVAARHWGNLP